MTFQVQTKEALEEFICQNLNEIYKYFDQKFEEVPAPIYSSVDIRESKNKFAPVDNNLYPAGFNNLCALDRGLAERELDQYLEKNFPDAKIIGIIPESNTKNTFYLDHLAVLGKLVRDTGRQVYFISPDKTLFDGNDKIVLESASHYLVEVHRCFVENSKIAIDQGSIDFILLNHDQSAPIDLDWKSLKTPIAPSPFMGWTRRSKARHFDCYHRVVQEFSQAFGIDPYLLEASYRVVDNVDFNQKEGLDQLASAVDELKSKIGSDKSIYVKASQGTYGMGIHVVSSGDEITNMNRKTRNKMDIGKNKLKFNSVVVQEGVDTILKYDNMPAEVAIYLINGRSVGGFMRANQERDEVSNLNSKGMVFKKFCISEIRQGLDHKLKETVYTVVARLSTLAAAYEIQSQLTGENI